MTSTAADLVCFGELLWDNLPAGKVAGGAPFNIVNRAQHLGLDSVVISSVGHDMDGRLLTDLVRSKGNSTDFIQLHPSLPTSHVNIELGRDGEPHYDIVYPVAWDDIKADERLEKLVSESKAVVYSSLALRDKRSRESLFHLLQFSKLKICDINLREGNYSQSTVMRMVESADILRMNEFELEKISEWHDLVGLTRRDQMSQLSNLYNYKCVIATLGGDGALCLQNDEWFVQPVFKVKVKDTVGAGDAFLASFIFKYLNEAPMQEALEFACAVGALTASKSGGTPEVHIDEITRLIDKF